MSPGDTVGVMTFIRSREEHISGDIEALEVRTIGNHEQSVLNWQMCGNLFIV
jgi:hypothetical protein